jgi:hypothetical protein
MFEIDSYRRYGCLVIGLLCETRQLISGLLSDAIKIWNTHSDECVHTTDGAHPSLVSQLGLNDSTDILYSASGHPMFSSRDSVIKVWRLEYR